MWLYVCVYTLLSNFTHLLALKLLELLNISALKECFFLFMERRGYPHPKSSIYNYKWKKFYFLLTNNKPSCSVKSTLKCIAFKVVYNWLDLTKHSVAKRLNDFSPSSLFTWLLQNKKKCWAIPRQAGQKTHKQKQKHLWTMITPCYNIDLILSRILNLHVNTMKKISAIAHLCNVSLILEPI